MAKIDLYSKDWCEMMFANRNKAYGAYVLRKEVGQRNTKALISVAIAIVVILVICYKFGCWQLKIFDVLWKHYSNFIHLSQG